MKKLLVSSQLSKEEADALSHFGKIIRLPPLLSLPSPINSHPDTLIARVGEKLFTYADYTDGAEILKAEGINIEKISSSAGNVYPHDVKLNCFEYNGVLFGRKKSLAEEIISVSGSICDVKQGYAHCATAVFDGGVITADDGIWRAIQKHGINSLKISPDGVLLDGYNCGFIGGACGQIANTAVFFGDVKNHPDGKTIVEFLSGSGLDVVCLSFGKLYDRGGIIVI
ncbi:MAG: hypothetical protein IJR55_01210 [Clostridia bacterium]|nr:hypothetical protein [Clostridia bacterium]